MKNVEYYKDKILELGGDIAIDKRTGELRTCNGLPCEKCKFNEGIERCQNVIVQWMCEEHRDAEETKRLIRSNIKSLLNCDYVSCADCIMNDVNIDALLEPQTIYDRADCCHKIIDLILDKGISMLLEEADYEI